MAEVGTLCHGLLPRSAGSGLLAKIVKREQSLTVIKFFPRKPVHIDSSDLVPLNMDVEVEKVALVLQQESDCEISQDRLERSKKIEKIKKEIQE